MNRRTTCTYTACLIIYRADAATTGPEPKTFDQGLIFIKDTDILLSGDKWTIVVNVALDDYVTLVDTVRLVLGHIRQKIQVQKNAKSYAFHLHWEEVNRLDVMTRELEVDINSFRKLLFEEASVRNPSSTRVRSKRELIDILGYGMKYLFGTADTRDVKRLAAVCDELYALETKMVHSADHQLTYLRTLDEGTKQTVKDTTG